MKYPDFAQCKDIAIKKSKQYKGDVFYGIYTPPTTHKQWDERWGKISKSFVHWWIEDDDHIIDAAAQQFGEPELKIVPKEDMRYQKVGQYIDGKTKPLTDKIKIDWHYFGPSTPMHVTWDDYDDYLRLLEQG